MKTLTKSRTSTQRDTGRGNGRASSKEQGNGAATAAPKISRAVSAFLKRADKMLIDGKWAPAASGKTFTTPNPATGEVLARCAEGDATDINRAVAAARKAFEDGPWRRMTASERGKII